MLQQAADKTVVNGLGSGISFKGPDKLFVFLKKAHQKPVEIGIFHLCCTA